MEKQNFIDFIKDLARYYGKTEFIEVNDANKDRIRDWYRKVRDLPGGNTLRDIYDRITDEFDAFPRNLPKTVKQYWEVWKKENKDRIVSVKEEITGCKNCLKGWINFVQQDEKTGRVYEYTCHCGHCRQLYNPKIPRLTIEQIEAEGGRVIRPGEAKPKKLIYDNLEDMTAAVGKKYEDEVPF